MFLCPLCNEGPAPPVPDGETSLLCEFCKAAVGTDFCDRKWACAWCARRYYRRLMAREWAEGKR